MLSTGFKITVKKATFLFFIFGFFFVTFRLDLALEQKIQINDTNETFIVEKGDSLYGILDKIEKKYDLSSTWWVRFRYIFKDYPVIKAGRYNIFNNSSVSELIERFEEGDVQLFKFSIIEGTVAQSNLTKLEKLILEENLNFKIPPEVAKLFSREGQIMPDTYFFSDDQDLVKVLTDSKDFLEKLLADEWKNKPEGNPLKSPEEALVLASIIEREAVLQSEQNIIASVFLARLKIGMKLQADPTSSYGYYQDYGGKIGRAVLDDKNLYNTYQITGLPPGPICFPSATAIKAAINSLPGEYFYFVAKGDGSHIFSKTYEEHNKAVKKYIYSK